MRVFETRHFAKLARKLGLRPAALLEAVERIDQGLVDADLGSGLYKQRVARAGAGKSGGFRTLVVFRSKDRAVFVYGFAKNAKDNISAQELADLRLLAKRILAFPVEQLNQAVARGDMKELTDD